MGHQQGQRNVIESNNPNTVAIASGILVTMGSSLIAATVFTVTTVIMGFAVLPFAGFLFPVIAFAIPFVLAGAHWFAKSQEKSRLNEFQSTLENPDDDSHILHPRTFLHIVRLNLGRYQADRLARWTHNEHDVNAWLSNGDRNGYGYTVMPLLGLAGLGALIGISAAHAVLPAALFGVALSAFPSLGIGLLMAAGIAVACVSLYFNHKKQTDNEYKLDFSHDTTIRPGAEGNERGLGQRDIHAHLGSRPQKIDTPATSPQNEKTNTDSAHTNSDPGLEQSVKLSREDSTIIKPSFT